MWQVLYTEPHTGISLYGYGLMLCLALFGSLWLAEWRARRVGVDPEIVGDMALWIFLGGIVGARLFYVFQYWGTRVNSFAEIFEVWKGGIVLYGSAIGGVIAFFIYRWFRPFPLLPMIDVIAPAVALGVALGRVGCFLNGCCYGDVCDLPWAVSFPKGSSPWFDQWQHGLIGTDAAWSLPVHPTQLYSALDGLVLLFLLSAYFPLRRRDGEVMALLVVTYPVTRFLIELLRNDEGVFAGGMTVSQNISLLLVSGGIVFWIYLRRCRPAELYAETQARPAAVEVAA